MLASPLTPLSNEKQQFLEHISALLIQIRGIKAIVLGGSHARGTAHPSSDLDIGLYYTENEPIDITAIRHLTSLICAPGKSYTVTELYEWGPWVNGGAWLNTDVGKVDFLYKNLDQIERVIEEAQAGLFTWDFAQQPPYGFHSVIYLAETKCCIPLLDPDALLLALKERVKIYPELLRKAIVQQFLWGAEFSLYQVKKNASDLYLLAGHTTRILSSLTQVLYALNREYFLNDKEVMRKIENFALSPPNYRRHIEKLFVDIISSGNNLQKLEELFLNIVELSEGMYIPKYSID